MSLLASGMQSRWGRLLEKKKCKQPLEGAPDRKEKKAVVTKIVALSSSASNAVCPECKEGARRLAVDTQEEFKMHVFKCRLKHGTDPRLPVVSLVPRPPVIEKVQWNSSSSRTPTPVKVPVPPAALRPVCCPPISIMMKPKGQQRDITPSEICTRANILAMKRLIKAHKGPSNLVSILKAAQQETELDLSDIEITPDDATALAVLLADHPSATVVDLGTLKPETKRFIAPLLLDVLQKNKNVVHINHTSSFDDRSNAVIEDRLEKSINAKSLSMQHDEVNRLTQQYEVWASIRESHQQQFSESEEIIRKEIMHLHSTERAKLRNVFKTNLAMLVKRRHRVEGLLLRQVQRNDLMLDEEHRRREIHVIEMGGLLWLVINHEVLSRAYLLEVQIYYRRQLKIAEEKGFKASKVKEKTRFERERQTRARMEEQESCSRESADDCQWFERCKLYSHSEAGRSHILYKESQAQMRSEMMTLCVSMRCGIEKEEEASRQWIYERKQNYLILKEQERTRARELVAIEEVSARVDIGGDFVKLMNILGEEMKYSLEWLDECVTLQNIEMEKDRLLNHMPEIVMSSCLEFNTKPFIYFVHSYSGMEPPVFITTSAKLSISLSPTWEDNYMEIIASRNKQIKVERNSNNILLKTRAKNSKVLKGIFMEGDEKVAVEPPMGLVKGTNKKKAMKTLQAAVKIGMRLSESLPACEIAEEKTKIKGGSLTLRLQPSDTDPPWLEDTVMLSCITSWDMEVDGVSHEGRDEVKLPASCWDTSYDDERLQEIPSGKVLKIYVPNGTEATTAMLTNIMRSCRFQTPGHGITGPVVIRILLESNLVFSNCDGGTVESSAELLCDVVLAAPFISYSHADYETVQYLEGMKSDELQLVPESFILTDPPTITKKKGQDNFTVMSGGLQGGGLSLTNFHDSYLIFEITKDYTPDDVIAFRNTAKLFVEDDTIHFKDKDGDNTIGRVTKGVLLPCSEVVEGVSCQPKCVLHLFHESNPGLLAAEHVRQLIRAFRFTNTSLAPVEGVRQVILTVVDINRFSSQIQIDVEVTGEDNPTEMHIPNLKLIVRPSQVPASLKQHVTPSIYPLAEGAIVQDVDTDRFTGGSLFVQLFNTTKSEGISLCTSEHLLASIIHQHNLKSEAETEGEATLIGRGRTISMTSLKSAVASSVAGGTAEVAVEGKTVFYKGREVGVIEKGEVTAEGHLDHVDGVTELLIRFNNNGLMSISGCQALLRRVALSTYGAKQGLRNIEVTLTIGPTVNGEPETDCEVVIPEFDEEKSCVLTEKITVRHTLPMLTIPEKYTLAEYREGTGPQRLAPFDLIHDKPGFIENYTNGFIAVEIIEGGCADDSLALREDETIKLVESKKRAYTRFKEIRKDKIKEKEQNAEEQESLPQVTPPPKVIERCFSDEKLSILQSTRMSELKDRMRDHVKEEAKERRERRESLIQAAQAEMKNLVKDLSKAKDKDMLADVMFSDKQVGVLRKAPNGLFITFKGEGTARRHALAVLKNLTYANTSSDPTSLKKLMRVTISDSPPSYSQCVYELQVIPVDDVTEITLRTTKLKYTSQGSSSVPCYLCPYGTACLTDADTEYFDGGHLTLQLSTGGTKGDQLGFVPLKLTDQLRKITPSTTCTGEVFDLKVTEDRKVLATVGDTELHVATLSFESDKNILKILFVKLDEECVSLAMASFMLNCVTFSNMQDTRKTSTRTYQVKIADGGNPVEGKAKMTVEVAPPLCCFLPFSYLMEAKYEAEMCFNELAKTKLTIVADKLDKPYITGTALVEVDLGEEHEPMLTIPSQYSVKEGGLYKDQMYYSKLVATPSAIKMTFTWASKVTAKTLQQLLRSITFSCTPQEVKTAHITTTITSETASTSCTAVVKF